MENLETGYQPLFSYHENGDDTPQETGVMIHVVPESSKARWNHIEDLDFFFTRYHQKHGFTCMMIQEVLELVQFIFVVLFTTFLLQCVDYPMLFHDKIKINATSKVSISDAVLPINQCMSGLNATIVICLIVASIFWILRLVKVIYHFFQFIEIKSFYATALKINESDLDNMTWHEVQRRMQEVQREQQMCIHKQELSELDIYHRILRFKNYMIAMVNKSLLPLRFNVPLLGDYIFLSKGLKYNLELILFWGPWAPFENNWHLKEDYKKVGKRKELAETYWQKKLADVCMISQHAADQHDVYIQPHLNNFDYSKPSFALPRINIVAGINGKSRLLVAIQLSKRILWIGIANFVLCPLILLWQILYSFFNYAEVIKREPGSLGARRWSLYGRLYLRHFNELDHELNARLNRGYRPAFKYMSIFTSHLLAIIAKNIVFFAGSILAVLIILTVYDEDVLQVEHVLTTITVLGVFVAGCRVFIPDEHLVWCPEKLMTSILAHIHYMPDHWKGNSHTTRVRDEFTQLFQYKAVYLFEELLSPIVTPVILCFALRHKALDVVDFYRNFTVEVVGVGDVCSFAQMDVRKHGNPQWMTEGRTEATQYQQAEDGKTELSLMHFTLTNPDWKPPVESTAFIATLKEHAQRDVTNLHVVQEENPLYYSLHSMSSLGAGYSSLVSSILRNNLERTCPSASITGALPKLPTVRGGLSHMEGPLHGSGGGLLSSLHPIGISTSSVTGGQGALAVSSAGDYPSDGHEDVPLEFTAADMSFSALYMHELHHRQCRNRGYVESSVRNLWQRPVQEMPNIQELPQEEDTSERMPLLDTRVARST